MKRNKIIYYVATSLLTLLLLFSVSMYAIWFVHNKIIKEWAYASFFFAFILAFFAHIMINDGEQTGALIAMILLITSYIFSKKI